MRAIWHYILVRIQNWHSSIPKETTEKPSQNTQQIRHTLKGKIKTVHWEQKKWKIDTHLKKWCCARQRHSSQRQSLHLLQPQSIYCCTIYTEVSKRCARIKNNKGANVRGKGQTWKYCKEIEAKLIFKVPRSQY